MQNELIKKISATLTEEINTIVITENSFDRSNELLQEIKDLKTQIDSLYDPGIKAAKTTVKELTSLKNQFATPLKSLEFTLKQKQRTYYFQKEKEAKEKQREFEEKARKEAEEKALNEAIEKENNGDNKVVDQILSTPIKIETIKIEPAIEVDKRRFRKKWKIQIIDKTKIPAKYMIPDEKTILADVRQANGAIDIPGIKISYE